jgi:hypothetical protein
MISSELHPTYKFPASNTQWYFTKDIKLSYLNHLYLLREDFMIAYTYIIISWIYKDISNCFLIIIAQTLSLPT